MVKKKSSATNELRFQMIVRRDSHPMLFDMLDEAGPYKMSKRMLAIAAAGAMLEHGGAVIAHAVSATSPDAQSPAASSKRRPPKATQAELDEDKTQMAPADRPHYNIPPGADDEMDNLFGTMGMSLQPLEEVH